MITNELAIANGEKLIANELAVIPRESDWLALVATMLICCPSAWTLEEFKTRNKSTTWSGLIIAT